MSTTATKGEAGDESAPRKQAVARRYSFSPRAASRQSRARWAPILATIVSLMLLALAAWLLFQAQPWSH